MSVVTVNLPDANYDVVVEPGALLAAGEKLRALTSARKIAVVTDSHVERHALPRLLSSLHRAGFEVTTAVVPAGEDHKHIHTIASIYDQLLPARLDRNTPIIALGGGVVGDMAGFVAATILRGVPFIQIPTTLLAMVDASVGGKTGVNHRVGKNLIGAFYQPKLVLIDPEALKTLPKEDLRGGLAECIKHDIIRDAAGFDDLEKNIRRAIDLDIAYLTQLIAHNVAIKARVVETDPTERGDRAHLNFGHTFGHAIETVSNYSYSHGESVALGMCAAVHAATSLGIFKEEDASRVRKVIAAAGLPTNGVTLDLDRVISTMIYDKKVAAGKIRFVLPDRIGHVVMRDDLPPEIVRAAVESLR